MAIMESIDFNYNGRYSSEFGIWNVTLSTGMYQEAFVASRSIKEIKVRGNNKPYFQGIEYEPLALKLSFAFQDTWDEEKIREVARWLMQDYYKPLYFSDNPDRIFYCMPIEESQLVHNGLKQGYVELTMRCDSPYTYSPVYAPAIIDLSSNPSGTLYKFTNNGDVICKPEIWINKIGAGDFRIVNTTNMNAEFKFTALANNETVYIDNEREYIETDIANTYRYSNFNNGYLELVRGVNNLMIYGTAKINFRYQFKTLQG
jgi:predicted phage tail component-like protein